MKILFISHEASLTGAPKVLLHFMRWLKETQPNVEIINLLGKGGAVEEEFKALGTTYIWQQPPSLWRRIAQKLNFAAVQPLNKKQRLLIQLLQKEEIDIVYGNTVLTTPILEALDLKVPSVLHIHELKYNIEQYGNSPSLQPMLAKADRVIAVSQLVYEYLRDAQTVEKERLRLIHEFIPPLDSSTCYTKVLTHLPEGAFVVGGCGTINWRKGTDLFVQVANLVLKQLKEQPIYFVWLGGNLKKSSYQELQHDVDKLGWSERVLFVGSHPNPQDYFNRFDLFLMTSREDPFPLVCLENAQLGNPIICFEDAVGSQEFIEDTTGARVSYLETSAMAKEVVTYYQKTEKREQAGKRIQEAVAEYTVEQKAPDLLAVLQELI